MNKIVWRKKENGISAVFAVQGLPHNGIPQVGDCEGGLVIAVGVRLVEEAAGLRIEDLGNGQRAPVQGDVLIVSHIDTPFKWSDVLYLTYIVYHTQEEMSITI